MAWIKLHGEIWDSWKIMRLCSALNISDAQAVGHLVSLWCFTERMAWRDGDLTKWGEVGVAKAARWTGDTAALVAALREASLLDQEELVVHEWTEHQAGMIRDREKRNPGKTPEKPRKNPAKTPAESLENPRLDKSREDKRRVEESREKKESLYSPAFTSFWQAYPNKTGKGDAWKAWQKANPDPDTCLKALEWQKLQPQWTKDSGRFIPHPSTWLNQKRWEDEPVKVDDGNAARPVHGKYHDDVVIRDGVLIKGEK